jgi:hypothetical protein
MIDLAAEIQQSQKRGPLEQSSTMGWPDPMDRALSRFVYNYIWGALIVDNYIWGRSLLIACFNPTLRSMRANVELTRAGASDSCSRPSMRPAWPSRRPQARSDACVGLRRALQARRQPCSETRRRPLDRRSRSASSPRFAPRECPRGSGRPGCAGPDAKTSLSRVAYYPFRSMSSAILCLGSRFSEKSHTREGSGGSGRP